MPQFTERRFQIPNDTPPRVVHDIETYSALVDMQSKLRNMAPWYENLA
jgi:hypothetical protein